TEPSSDMLRDATCFATFLALSFTGDTPMAKKCTLELTEKQLDILISISREVGAINQTPSFLRLLGAGCLMVVVLTHVSETLHLLPLGYTTDREWYARSVLVYTR